ncbi:MAG: PIN domain-containing protein [Bacteroidia bacterium]|nr:PIN domain-containing protein [Bacteroidia bacterium]
MNDRIFLDTNVLVYCYTSTEPVKRSQALVAAGLPDAWISTQVCNELSHILFRKFRQDWPSVRRVLAELKTNFQIWNVSVDTAELAASLAEQTGYSFYDSLMLAAGIEAGCGVLFTEDLRHGQLIRGVQIQNPFLTA